MSWVRFNATSVFRTVVTLVALALVTGVVHAQPAAAPELVLNPQGLADDVDPGDIFATLGDVAIFWLDELDLHGTTSVLDDTVRLALWSTDGTPAGTHPLLPPEVSLFSYWPDTLNGVLFFTVCRAPEPISALSGASCDLPEWIELWRTDGTQQGTYRLLQGDETFSYIPGGGAPPAQLVPELGTFFFVTNAEGASAKLWGTDGSKQGTRLVSDLSTLGFAGASGLVAFDGALYFYGYQPGDDETLHPWVGRSDGTTAGTTAFRVELGDSEIISLWKPAGDRLFLVALSNDEEPDPVTGLMLRRRTLWALERGSQAFRQIADLGFRRPGSSVRARGAQGRLFFEFADFQTDPVLENPYPIWASDGTPQGTAQLGTASDDQVGGHLWTDPLGLPGGRALVSLYDGSSGQEPWSTDGTPSGTKLLADICPGPCDSQPADIAVFDGWYYFSAEAQPRDRELWRWRPQDNLVEQVADLCPGECGGYPSVADQVDGRLFLRAYEPAGIRQNIWEVWPDGPGAREVAHFDDVLLGGLEFIFQRVVYSWKVLGDHAIFWGRADHGNAPVALWSMATPASDPPPPDGPDLTTDELPGFTVKVRITPSGGTPILGRSEAACIPETLCVSGAIEGRSEVFVRVVGPKPNGYLWPTLVKFTTSTVEVWIEQVSTGTVRYYRLGGASPGSSDLPGLFDREGFTPQQ